MGAAEHWLRFGIDGWRLDVAEEIDAGFWREFRTRVRAINPDAYIVAEIWREKPAWLSGDTFDALMNYPLTEALLSFTAARQLDMAVVADAARVPRVRAADRTVAEFAARLEQLMHDVPAAGRRRAAQPAGQPRHGALRDASPAATSRRSGWRCSR